MTRLSHLTPAARPGPGRGAHVLLLLSACLLWRVEISAGDLTVAPQVFSVSPGALPRLKTRVAAGDPLLRPALDKLVQDADKALTVNPPSVLDKSRVAPSGDKHDYYSTAPYFWPDPAKKDGLPYLRHDGQRNPEASGAASDSGRLNRMASNAETLALAYYLTGNTNYAAHAARLLRVWFLDPATHMNPNFNHAQAVPGVNDGRGTGMIESRSLTRVCDAASLLRGCAFWPAPDQAALTAWMRAFLAWAQTSKNGRAEAEAKNNHGSFYDVQVAHLALFLGETNRAREIVEAAKARRLAAQIRPDGSQPLELARADSFGYSRFNLQGLFALATLGEYVGVDLWQYRTPEGGSIRQALDFLVPYVEDQEKPWPYEHGKKAGRNLAGLLRTAHRVYGDPKYLAVLGPAAATDREALFFPP
jgi:hypothetical protein